MQPDASRPAYRGKLFSVTVERWGDREREIVEHPGSVAIVALDDEEHVTLVRQRREAARTELLELPAGTLEPGEEPLAAAQRELAEETGLTGGRWTHGGRLWTTPGFCRELMHLYFAEGVEPGAPAPDEDEEVELVRLPLAQLEARVGELEDAKTLAGILLYLRIRSARG